MSLSHANLAAHVIISYFNSAGQTVDTQVSYVHPGGGFDLEFDSPNVSWSSFSLDYNEYQGSAVVETGDIYGSC